MSDRLHPSNDLAESHREAVRRVVQRVMLVAQSPTDDAQAIEVTEADGTAWHAVYVVQTDLWAVVRDDGAGPVLRTDELVSRVMCRWPDVETVPESEVLQQ